jgi:hypothetical protein
VRLVADIVSIEPKLSQEQIAAAIKYQNELFPRLMRLSEADQRARTNAIARSHSGIRTLHVQEWSSEGGYRLDYTDEGLVKLQPGTYAESFVNIGDRTLSPYRSFLDHHLLRDAQLSKILVYAQKDLWRAAELDPEFVFPLLIALGDSKSLPHGRPPTDAEFSQLKISPSKAELIHNGSHPLWHLQAIAEDGQEERTRFIFRGRTISPIEPRVESDMQFVYEVGRAGQKPVCMEASLTNYTTHSSFISKKEGFDNQGFPHVWKRTTVRPDAPAEHTDVVFKEVEANPGFTDQQIFSPVFGTNYIVSDITSGQAVVLQNPSHFKVVQPLAHVTSVKRVIILCMLALPTIAMGIALVLTKRKRSRGVHGGTQ